MGACSPGDAAGSCPTCAERVKIMTDNLMGVQEAMDHVACTFGGTCQCLKEFCGNTQQQCCGGEVCVGSVKSYTCAGSCATNEACGPGDTPGSCPTCADRVKTLTDNLMGVEEAMDNVGCAYAEHGCQCLKEFCGNTAQQCCGGQVCVGGMKSYA